MERICFKRKGKLIYEYIFILILVAGILLISFLTTGYIVNYSVMEQSRQSAEVIFQQAEERVRIFEEDIDSLYMNVVQNGSVTAFFAAEDLAGRWENLRGFYQVVGNNMRINRNLQNILLYNAEGELIATKGDVFFPGHEPGGLIGNTYSDRIEDKKTGEIYFEVGMPVYSENTGLGYHQIGSVYLLFDVKNLQSIVDGALPNEESAVGILDKNGAVVVSSGQWQEEYGKLRQTGEDEVSLNYVSAVGNTGWRMISVVPKRSMLSGIALMQRVNYITYLMVLVAMCLVCGMIYKRIILPISRQTSFMDGFTKDTGQRIEVTENNEIGEMARKMNEMLDDIEQLNGAVIDSEKKYLELEYAKKQTEMIAYKSQINPHFLYNTFNCIRGMALYRGEKEIAELTMALSSFFRYSVQGEEMVTVQEALENLQHYARIIQYRFNGKHAVEVEAEREVLAVKIPKMLIQPLVENGVLHGLETKVGGGRVLVEVSRQGRRLNIIVSDNGSGISEETLDKLHQAMECYDREETIPEGSLGIGFLNVYRRMRLFYGSGAEFEVNSRPGEGCRVRMLLPVEIV